MARFLAYFFFLFIKPQESQCFATGLVCPIRAAFRKTPLPCAHQIPIYRWAQPTLRFRQSLAPGAPHADLLEDDEQEEEVGQEEVSWNEMAIYIEGEKVAIRVEDRV